VPAPDHPGHRELIAALVEALRDEERARREFRASLRRQAALLGQLSSLGLPTSTVVHRVARAQGLTLGLRERLRLAERFRKRRWRGTRCPADLGAAHGQSPSAASRSDWAIAPTDKESIMPKLVKRTTVTETEEFKEVEDGEEHEDEADEGEEEEEHEESTPARRRRR
jgi:hypothetical protein